MTEITDRHLAILAVLDRQAKRHGAPQTFPTISRELGFPKDITVFTLRPLIQEGMITTQTVKRGIRYSITSTGITYLEDSNYLINGEPT